LFSFNLVHNSEGESLTVDIAFSFPKTKPFIILVVLPAPSEGWGRGETPRKPNSRAMPHGLDQRSKIEEVVLKMAR